MTQFSLLLLYQLGSDQLERLFYTIRTITHFANFDFLELVERIIMAFQIEMVYANNPNLRRDSRLSSDKSTLDYSSTRSWCGELSTENIRLTTVWSLGRRKAEATLRKFGYEDNHFNLSAPGITLL